MVVVKGLLLPTLTIKAAAAVATDDDDYGGLLVHMQRTVMLTQS